MEEFKIQTVGENPQKDLYREWQKMMIRGGHIEANEINPMSYVNYVINESNNAEDFNQALRILDDSFNDEKGDLIASVFIYIKMGDYKKAQRIIENVSNLSTQREMTPVLKKLFEKSPEIGKETLEYIKQNNPDYFNKLDIN